MILYGSRDASKPSDLNAHLIDDKMLLWNHVNLGIAVDTEEG